MSSNPAMICAHGIRTDAAAISTRNKQSESEYFGGLSLSTETNFDESTTSLENNVLSRSNGRHQKRALDEVKDDKRKKQRKETDEENRLSYDNNREISIVTPYSSQEADSRQSTECRTKASNEVVARETTQDLLTMNTKILVNVKNVLRKAVEAQLISQAAPLNYITEIVELYDITEETVIRDLFMHTFSEGVNYITMAESRTRSASIHEAVDALGNILSMIPGSLYKANLTSECEVYWNRLYQLEGQVDVNLGRCTKEDISCQARVLAYSDLVNTIAEIFRASQHHYQYLSTCKKQLRISGRLTCDQILMMKEDWSCCQQAASSHLEVCLVSLEKAREEQEHVLRSINEVILKKHYELAGTGESDLSAQYSAYSAFLKSRDPDNTSMRQLYKTRHGCVRRHVAAFQSVKQRQIFIAKLQSFLSAIEQRSRGCLDDQMTAIDQWQQRLATRVETQLSQLASLLMGGILKLNEFHDLQRSRATLEIQDLMKKLQLHLECFGDSAPIKKGDIEGRIREFTRIRDKSTTEEMELANDQTEIWLRCKEILATESVLQLSNEFVILAKKLKGPVQRVYAKLASSLSQERETPLDASPKNFALQPHACDDEFIIEVGGGIDGQDEDDHVKLEDIQMPILLHRYAVGTNLYAKVNLDGKKPIYLRGKIVKHLDKGRYMMLFDTGDMYTVSAEHLFGQKEIEQEVATEYSDESTDEEDLSCASSIHERTTACIVM